MPFNATKALFLGLVILGAPAIASATLHPAEAAGASLQGDQSSWIDDPHMHAFYTLAVTAFANGAGSVDRTGFERDSTALFRAFAKARGVNPDAMVDHLKLIPGQVIDIATRDPKTLATYSNFVAALFGPQ